MVTKSTPKGIDPAYPNKNFVKTYYENRGDMDGYYEYMYPRSASIYGDGGQGNVRKKSNAHGHGVGQRAGKLRLKGCALSSTGKCLYFFEDKQNEVTYEHLRLKNITEFYKRLSIKK